jgi:hypothetical protein
MDESPGPWIMGRYGVITSPGLQTGDPGIGDMGYRETHHHRDIMARCPRRGMVAGVVPG